MMRIALFLVVTFIAAIVGGLAYAYWRPSGGGPLLGRSPSGLDVYGRLDRAASILMRIAFVGLGIELLLWLGRKFLGISAEGLFFIGFIAFIIGGLAYVYRRATCPVAGRVASFNDVPPFNGFGCGYLDDVNPATGLPMVGVVDAAGRRYGEPFYDRYID